MPIGRAIGRRWFRYTCDLLIDQPGKKAAWLAVVKADGLEWTQLSDLKFWNNVVEVLYGIKSIPQNFLLDKDGKIVAANLRGEDLEKTLAELL